MSTISLKKFMYMTLALLFSSLVTISAIAENEKSTTDTLLPPERIIGRWVWASAEGKIKTLDITKCGENWCGVDVDTTGKCGHVALKLKLTGGEQAQYSGQFTGQYSVTKGSELYAVGAGIWEKKGSMLMSIYGHTGGEFQPFRRMYPLNIQLSREGDAVCKADASVS